MAIRRFRYGMRHQWITGARIGEILPCFFQEVAPGDTWNGRQLGLFRVSPLDKPAFSALNVSVHFFFVPWRLVFDEFEDVMTGVDTVTTWPNDTRGDSTDNENLFGQFGAGPTATGTYAGNSLPTRAYNLIFNEF